jgi:hypothetical protein
MSKRKSPSQSASSLPIGSIEFGNDKNKWVVKNTINDIHRWVPYHSCALFGYTPLTVNILKKNIDIPIIVYEKQFNYSYPKKSKDFDVKYKFIASGDVFLNGKLYKNWLITKKPQINKNDMLIIDGELSSNDYSGTIHAAPIVYGELVSSNLMNTAAFIKIL